MEEMTAPHFETLQSTLAAQATDPTPAEVGLFACAQALRQIRLVSSDLDIIALVGDALRTAGLE